MPYPLGNDELRLELTRRFLRDIQAADKFRDRLSLFTFRNIGGDRYCRSLHLISEPKTQNDARVFLKSVYAYDPLTPLPATTKDFRTAPQPFAFISNPTYRATCNYGFAF